MTTLNEILDEQTTEPTITVSSWMGKDKDLTKDEFVKQWTDHVVQVSHIAGTDWPKYEQIKKLTAELAEDEFDRLAESQWNLDRNAI